ncbi:hypothetical protein PILCRDRAFT_526797 [Piloderma croceum F 1598]|uniref:G-protein coupled receptors family 1 profile domain-containing protein n=1 Tax=Piloderma croceum (strain F 1598) TaxID=765440 RepID=A0A0C3FM00_PILCF|nr:hypothetical protein PILCRDRAFT_526797 [Piloderma croceum F 1598]
MSDVFNCLLEEQAVFNTTQGTKFTCLTRGDSIGLTLAAEAGFISLVAVLGVFMLIMRNTIQSGSLIRQPTDIYMISLFLFDIIMALGRVTDVKWIHEGKVYVGGFCTAQGVLQQIGETGSALATLAIAIYTFVVVLWGPARHPYFVAYTVVGLNWLFITLFVAISVPIHTHGSDYYEQLDGFWCWIGNQYTAERYAGEYIWMWVTMFLSFLAYTPLFFWARGNLTVSPTHWWKFEIHTDKNAVRDLDPDGRKRRAIGMIAYPLVFAIITLPTSVVRWVSDFGKKTSHNLTSATFAVEFLFSLSGAFNVALFLATRSDLLLPRNMSSKRNKTGMAPAIASSESDTEVNDLVSSKSDTRQRERVSDPMTLGLLPGADDGGWHLPAPEEDSDDLA